MIVIAIIAIIAAVAIPNLLAAKKSANEASAIGSLRAIVSAEAVYLERSAAQTYSDSLLSLSNANLIDSVLGTGQKEGYLFFQVAGALPSSASGPTSPSTGLASDAAYNFNAIAEPRSPSTGNRFFFVDQTGVIRFNVDLPADVSSQPLGKQ